jgi:hypothetical protein
MWGQRSVPAIGYTFGDTLRLEPGAHRTSAPRGSPMSIALVAVLTGVCFAGAIAAITLGLIGR